MSELEAASQPEQVGEGMFRWETPAGWEQGRGAYGGLVIAALVRAIEATVGMTDHAAATPERRLRSATAELCGPTLPGPSEIRVETLRAGQGMTTAAARLLQGGEVQAHIVAILGRARASVPGWLELWPPDMPDWRTLPVLHLPDSVAPPFSLRFEYWLAAGVPFSGEEESAFTTSWIRARDPVARRDAAYVAAMSDVVWPSTLVRLATPRPMATVSYMLEIVGDFEGLEPDAPLFHRGRTVVAHEGHTVEFRELWGDDGRLIALNQQTIVLIK